MADIALTAVNPITPAPQKTGQEASGAEAPADQASFASVLKQRSANQTESQGNKSTTSNSREAKQEAASGTEAEAATTAEGATGTQVDAMLAALGNQLTGVPADKPQDPLVASDDKAKSGDNTAAAQDPSLLAGLPQTANPVALPLAAPANAAGQAASLAADGEGKADAKPALLNVTSDAKPEAQAPAVTATVERETDTNLGAQVRNTGFGEALAAAQRHAASVNAQVAAPQTQATHAAELPQHVVRSPVGSTGWADELGQRVSWVANHDAGRAELVLTPPSMGRVEVSINMNGDQANASFVAANPAAREALQDALPRLREMLAQAGIQLAQADVSAGQQGQAQADAQAQGSRGGPRYGNNAMGNEQIDTTSTLGRIQSGRGMVDIFA